ncbi:MAG: sigma-70 family RNA polymerase sigma factor [Clostridia bacterium]|jgi:RNA polymerase sigma-70 factor (ECF subfamily)|nr:sigma-70 family RNA polymerase sigma factor [Clostridia bacterium]
MNKDWFDRVYEKTHRRLLRYAIVHLSDPTDAEDALQNVYVDFYRRVERYGHLDILVPQSYLMRMLRNEITKHYAERSRQATVPLESLEETVSDGKSFEDDALAHVTAEQILLAAKSLPAETYRVFVLYYGFEMSAADIAAELNIGREAVKSRLFRARNALKNRLTASEQRRNR